MSMVNVSQLALISAPAGPNSLEAILICPTYRLLAAFPGRSHKVCFAVCCCIIQFEDLSRENLPFHPAITLKILPIISPGKRRSTSAQYLGSDVHLRFQLQFHPTKLQQPQVHCFFRAVLPCRRHVPRSKCHSRSRKHNAVLG